MTQCDLQRVRAQRVNKGSMHCKASGLEETTAGPRTCCRQPCDGEDAKDGKPQRVVWLADTKQGIPVEILIEGANLQQSATPHQFTQHQIGAPFSKAKYQVYESDPTLLATFTKESTTCTVPTPGLKLCTTRPKANHQVKAVLDPGQVLKLRLAGCKLQERALPAVQSATDPQHYQDSEGSGQRTEAMATSEEASR